MRKILEAATAECRYVNGSIIEGFTGFFFVRQIPHDGKKAFHMIPRGRGLY
jgi:hypothetical protein